jgi:hypothetical protein
LTVTICIRKIIVVRLTFLFSLLAPL